jgi:hypothetical protein
MKCPLCGHHKAHKHGKTEKGHQRYNPLSALDLINQKKSFIFNEQINS